MHIPTFTSDEELLETLKKLIKLKMKMQASTTRDEMRKLTIITWIIPDEAMVVLPREIIKILRPFKENIKNEDQEG